MVAAEWLEHACERRAPIVLERRRSHLGRIGHAVHRRRSARPAFRLALRDAGSRAWLGLARWERDDRSTDRYAARGGQPGTRCRPRAAAWRRAPRPAGPQGTR